MSCRHDAGDIASQTSVLLCTFHGGAAYQRGRPSMGTLWRGFCTFRVQTHTQIPGEVGEEALVVQVVAQQLCEGTGAHGLPMNVLIHHIPGLQHLLQSPDVRLEAR